MISDFHKNCLGTLTFSGKFPGMRKAQEFDVYPMKEGEYLITIQSDTRIGTIDIVSGKVCMSPPRQGGTYFAHLALARKVCDLDSASLLILRAQLTATASGMAGTNGIVFCDNSGALGAMGDLQ